MKRWLFLVCICGAVFCSAPAPAFQGLDFSDLRRVAEQGNPDAQSKLGVMYANGIGVAMDKKAAAEWYAKSAQQGYPVGLWNLAFMYVRGEGVAADYAKARALFQKAAEKDLASAQYDLGVMYLDGLGGARDRGEGEKWLKKAAAQGYREAELALKELAATDARGGSKNVQ